MKSNQQIELEKLFQKILAGEMNRSEKQQLEEYIETSHNDEALNELLFQHWTSLAKNASPATDINLRPLKEKLHREAFQKNAEHEKTRRLNSNWKSTLVRIAAMLTIPLLVSSLYMSYRLYHHEQTMVSQNIMQTVVASPGSRVHFTLPDQTDVWLNSESRLEFPVNMATSDQRRVKLTGQGYFNVAHDKKHPFFVETGDINIKVLGTSFDVSSYPDDETMCSTLEEGSIAVLDNKDNEIGTLTPGEKVIVDKQSKQLEIRKVDTHLYTSWKDGKLIFKNTPLPVVTKQMERWFNCSIHVDQKLANSEILYTATIQQETLGEVLKMIEISTSVKTKIVNREVQIWSEE